MRQEEGGEPYRDRAFTIRPTPVRSPSPDEPTHVTYPQGGAMTRSRAAAVLACLAASLAILVLAGFTWSSADSAKKGGTMRIGTINGYDSMNPFVAFSSQSYDAFIMQYPTLVQYKQLGKDQLAIEGDLAKSWKTSKDGKTWTFDLHPGVWSDGKPLTAKAAVWTGNLVLKYKAGPTATLAPFISHAV